MAEACECTLSTQRSGTGIGDAVRNHVVVPAAVFAQSEPDRTTVEVHQTSRFLRPLPADLRSVSSCHPRGSRRSFNHSRRKAEVADDAQVPAIRSNFSKTPGMGSSESFRRNRSAETKHRRSDPAFKPPAPPSGSGGGAAGALLAAASSAFWRIRSASRGTLPRPRTRSWRYSQKLTPNRRHVFFKLAKVSRARRPESLRVLPLIFRFLT